jgi:AcrR family transcriptional regulator
MLAQKTYHHGNLRATCIQNGIEILLEEGIEKLTLRNVAKKSNVSHNAPYRSFKDKEDLLAAIAQEIYAELTHEIFAIIQNPSELPSEDFRKLCTTFYAFATNNPIKYRFIAGNTVNHEGNFSQLTDIVNEAYDMVRNFIFVQIQNGNFRSVDPDKMAIHCIATIHGFCLIVIENKLKLLQSQLPDYAQELVFIIEQLLYILQPNSL